MLLTTFAFALRPPESQQGYPSVSSEVLQIVPEGSTEPQNGWGWDCPAQPAFSSRVSWSILPRIVS